MSAIDIFNTIKIIFLSIYILMLCLEKISQPQESGHKVDKDLLISGKFQSSVDKTQPCSNYFA